MNLLKQSTAATIKLGPFVDSTDGVTPETGLTISQADIRLSKNGGAFAQSNNIAGAVHDENGWYGIPLDTTDTGTLGRLQVAVYESGALPCFSDFMVVPANVYDSLVAGTDVLTADVTQIGGVTQSATDLKDFADDGYDPTTNKIQGVVLTDTCTTLTGHTAQTGDSFARLGAPAGASIAADLVVIDNFVDDLEGRLTAARAGYLDNLSAGAVALEATLTTMKQKAAGAFDRETDSLEALRDRGDAAWITATGFATAAVCTEARLAELDAANLITDVANVKTDTAAILIDTAEIGAAGAGLTALGDARIANLDATVSTRATPAQVNTEVVDVLTVDTIAEMAQGAPPSAPTMQQIINYLYRMWRNKITTTATTISLYDDAGAVVLTKSTISDDGTTFTKGEHVTGA